MLPHELDFGPPSKNWSLVQGFDAAVAPDASAWTCRRTCVHAAAGSLLQARQLRAVRSGRGRRACRAWARGQAGRGLREMRRGAEAEGSARDPSCVRAGSRGVWEWGVGLKKELTKEKIKDRLKVTRARDRSVDTAAFSFLREHVKGSRTRLERVRSAAKQSISALRHQSQHACAWAAELELLAKEHWQGGVVVSAVERMVCALQSAEKQRVLLLVSAQQRLLETVEGLLMRYDAVREDKLRLYWARGAVEEAADRVKHYRRKINDGKSKQEAKMQTALNEVLMHVHALIRICCM